jgi:hypothetical protein
MTVRLSRGHTFDPFAIGHLLVKILRITLSGKDDTNHAFLSHAGQSTDNKATA